MLVGGGQRLRGYFQSHGMQHMSCYTHVLPMLGDVAIPLHYKINNPEWLLTGDQRIDNFDQLLGSLMDVPFDTNVERRPKTHILQTPVQFLNMYEELCDMAPV